MASTISLKAISDDKTDTKQNETCCLIWLDASPNTSQNQDIEQKLRSIIDYFKKFQEVKPCQKYIEQSSDIDRIILIVSGQLGREIIPHIHGFPQVASIYIFCYNPKNHEKWAEQYAKIKAVLNNLQQLFARITEERIIQKKVDEPLPIDIFTTAADANESTMDVNGRFVFSQVLFDCVLRIKSNKTDRTELINACKKEHEGNSLELQNILDFENNYTAEKALRWYTKETFFYKSLNAALRKQHIHMIFLFREFISDIQRQLQKHQSNKVFKVYRGQMMSIDELERLKQSIGKLISINSFFSTSMNYNKAFSFLIPSRGLQRVLFEIKADPKNVTTKPFADITQLSAYPGESEMLFMIGSIFRLEGVRQDDTDLWVVRMTLSSDEEHGLKEVLLYMKGQMESGEANLRTLGKFLWKMGKFELAEQYLLRLLKELEPDDPLNSVLFEDLGDLAALTGNYDKSIQYQQKSLGLKNSKQMNDTRSLQTLSSAAVQQPTIKSGDEQQKSTASAANETETRQFKEWLENYLKQYVRALAQQSSSAERFSNSVENFCYILESQSSITDDEQQTLRGLINFGCTFDDINSEECIKLFRSIQNERIILIASKKSLENLAKPIREEPFLSAIYVIDSSTDNEFDLKVYRGSFANMTKLCRQLEKDLPMLAYNLTLISSIPADYTKMSTFSYVQTLKNILLEADEKQDLKQEMIDFCRDKYDGNAIQLKLINEFENNFQPSNAIQWFTRQETFVYKMLTRAFRILDADILYKLRYVIQPLHQQLQSSSSNNSLTVYRTLRVRKDLFKKMNDYKNGLLSFNEFLFTSRNQAATEPFPVNLESKLVHFQMDLGTGVPKHTLVGKSNEILLTIGTVFRIESIEPIDGETFTVKLTTNSNIQRDGQLTSKDLYDTVRGPFPLVRILKLMRQRDLKIYMEYFANILSNDPRTPGDETANLTLGGVLHSIGGHCYEKKQYDQGLIHLQNALDVYQRVLSPNDTRLTPTYNNMGSIYFKQNLNEKALEYHQKAYDIQKNSTSPDLESVSAYVGNIAGALDRLGRHKEAIKYSEIDLKIQQKLNSNKDNVETAVKYHNLAGRQYRAHLYVEALENYQKCLEIELKCHSADNPTVAVTYHNMATALDKLGRFQEAKVAVEKAIERLLRTKKEDDEDVQMNKKYMQQLEQKIWMKDLLAST